MIKWRFSLLAAVVVMLVSARAEALVDRVPGTGLGLTIGSPMGVTARHWLSADTSLEAGAGWSLSNSRFQVNGSYLWNRAGLFQVGEEPIDLFFGLGLSLRTKSGTADGEVVFGPRLPVGVSFWVTDPDIEFFLQGALNVGLIPSSDLYVDAGVGLRFYLF
jgi:hypothetical protein